MKSNNIKLNGIILAAGIGTRLRPLTEYIPKPLMPVHGRPLLQIIMEKMKSAGIAKIAVNTHHLAEQIRDFVQGSEFSKSVRLYHENEILGTGGPLVNAREFLSENESFILHNGDIYSDIDLRELIDVHLKSGNIATMVLADGHENRVLVPPAKNHSAPVLDILGKLGVKRSDSSLLTYTGIAVFSRDIFKYLPEKPEFCSIVTAIISAISEKTGSVGAYVPGNVNWSDIGTVREYFKNFDEHSQRQKCARPLGIEPIAQQGSNRKFYRMKFRDKDRVLMLSSPDDKDFDRFIRIGGFLHKLRLGVPEIYKVEGKEFSLMVEDLGDDTVCRIVNSKNMSDIYRRIIDWLVDFQVKTYACLDETKREVDRYFDFEGLRWETDYFRENFLEKYLGIDKGITSELSVFFDFLANENLKIPQVLIHRDFQSQNILIQDGQVRVVDFQGARIGPLAYDIMALLRDSYIVVPADLRKELLNYYYDEFNAAAPVELRMSREEFAKFAVLAGLQRNMQALGAFTFLSLVKGKKRYFDYIPSGIRHLLDGIKELEPFCDNPLALMKLYTIVNGSVSKNPEKR